MKRSKEMLCFLLVVEILETHGSEVDNISIHESGDGLEGEYDAFKVYNSDGYCFELKKEYACEPDEVSQFEGVDSDGYCYTFCEPWDGFKEAGIDKAISIFQEFARV